MRRGDCNSTSDSRKVWVSRVAGLLPYISYEEGQRMCRQVHGGIAAALDAVSPQRCEQPLCAKEEEEEERSLSFLQ